MQDLRSKLKKAGLISKKQARAAKTESRKAQKQAPSNKKRPPEGTDQVQSSLQQKRQQAQQHQERLNQERAEKARLAQIRDLIQTHRIKDFRGDDCPFHFVGRGNRIQKFITTNEMARALSLGRAAIVAVDDNPRYDYAVVSRKCAERLEALDAGWILFWNKAGTSADDLPAYGGGE